MNLGLHLFNYLQEKGSAKLPNFGAFTLQKKSASLDEKTSKLLPPTQEISFEENKDIFNADLSKYIVEKTGENLFIVQTNIKEEVASWLEELNQNHNLYIDELGEFNLQDGKIILIDKKDFTKNPQYFGLEEINIQEINFSINKEEAKENAENEYVFNNSILWIFLFILPVGALIFLGLKYQDQLFGKKSFGVVSVKTTTHRIDESPTIKDSVKTDSIQNIKVDSLRTSK